MATETIVKLIDDLDGTVAAETITFGLDGRTYEIELSTKNANKLRNSLATYMDAGCRISTPTPSVATKARQRPPAPPAPQPTNADDNRAIREWAEQAGIPVALRGRIKQEVVDAYHAHPKR